MEVEFMFGANTEAKKKATEEILRQTRAASNVDVHRGEDDLWKLASERLCHQIKTDGSNLGKGILKVNSFINHRVDVGLMDLCGHALADCFKGSDATLVLTAQTSGVLPAQACARYLDRHMIFAREKKPITITEAYQAGSKSHTRHCDVSLFVAKEFLTSKDKVLIVDDFLASGTTAVALLDIVRQAGATCVGFGFLVEKEFEKGRELLLEALKEDEGGEGKVGGGGGGGKIVCLANVVALEGEEGGKIQLSGGRKG
ncbi:xanthine phosphoribosyltransferase [Nannochloropsis oceanica]